MISVFEADLYLDELGSLMPSETVDLAAATGRVLREDVRADRPFPPFDRCMMDGYAIRAADGLDRSTGWRVEGRVAAGHVPPALAGEGVAVRVFTGAAMPPGADTVVPQEHVIGTAERFFARADHPIRAGQFVHRTGSDHPAGDVLLRCGQRLGSREIGVAAAAGYERLVVGRRPRVGILSSGDELVPLGQPVGPYGIRPSNLHALASALARDGLEQPRCHLVPDDRGRFDEALEDLRAHCDVILVTGGLAHGDADLAPPALQASGATIHLRGVRQRPGRPFLVADYPGGPLVFGLPGNPVSTLTVYHRYVRPKLRLLAGARPDPAVYAVLAEPFEFGPSLTAFVPVRLETRRDGMLTAFAQPAANSGDLVALVGTDGFLELPGEAMTEFAQGFVARFWRWA